MTDIIHTQNTVSVTLMSFDLEVDTPFLWYTMYKTRYTVSDPDRCSSRIVLPDHPVFRGMKFGQQHPVDEHGDLGYDNTEIATQ